MRRLPVITVTLLLFLSTLVGCGAPAEVEETDTAANEDVFAFIAVDQNAIRPLVERFESAQGRVNIEAGSADTLVTKILGDSKGTADLLWTDSLVPLQKLVEAGATEPISPELVSKLTPESLVAQRKWIPIYHRILILAVHPDVKLPNSDSQLWTLSFWAKLRQRQGWVTNHPMWLQFVAQLSQVKKEESEAWLRLQFEEARFRTVVAGADQQPQYFRRNVQYPQYMDLGKAIARGEVDMGLLPYDVVHQLRKSGISLRVVAIPELGCVVDSAAIATCKDRPNSSGSDQWIKSLLSKTAQQYLCSEFGFYPVIPDVLGSSLPTGEDDWKAATQNLDNLTSADYNKALTLWNKAKKLGTK